MKDLFDLPFEEDPREARTDRKSPAPPRAPQPAAPAKDTTVSKTAPAATRRIFTVTELTIRVRDLLESQFFEVWVEGELSNCKIPNTGHLYFTLKDESTQLRGLMFRSALRYLKFKPADGQRVIARGKISVYEPRGEYQIVCEHLEPKGLGALQLAYEQLKKRLQAEGLFDT